MIGNFLSGEAADLFALELLLELEEAFRCGVGQFGQRESRVHIVVAEVLLFACGQAPRGDDARGFAEVGGITEKFGAGKVSCVVDVQFELGGFGLEIFDGARASAGILIQVVIDEIGFVPEERQAIDMGEVGILGVFVFVTVFLVVEETFLGALE